MFRNRYMQKLAQEVLKLKLICLQCGVHIDTAYALHQEIIRNNRFMSVYDALKLTQEEIFMNSPRRN